MIRTLSIADPIAEAGRLRKSTRISDILIENTKSIMNSVAAHGDSAVLDYTKKFDGAKLRSLKVTQEEIRLAYTAVTAKQIRSIKHIKNRLKTSELALLQRFDGKKPDDILVSLNSAGLRLTRTLEPIQSVGCYVPGGKARYPSSLVMCAVPAKVAGVGRIVAISPPLKDGTVDALTLVASDICGIDEFYKIGGVQGIAALAYGTETIKPVSKIVGPGGLHISSAKFLASRVVATDMIAGPTELLIYADSVADPRMVALDLISQAEHGEDTICGLVTCSEKLATAVQREIQTLVSAGISRGDIVRKSLQVNGFIAVCRNESAAIQLVNEFAPEHLQIVAKKAKDLAERIVAAGLILIGGFTPSSASDYCMGSNHVLPTLGSAKSRASLSVLDFVKIVTRIESTRLGLTTIAPFVKEVAYAEGLLNHYEAVRGRLDEKAERNDR